MGRAYFTRFSTFCSNYSFANFLSSHRNSPHTARGFRRVCGLTPRWDEPGSGRVQSSGPTVGKGKGASGPGHLCGHRILHRQVGGQSCPRAALDPSPAAVTPWEPGVRHGPSSVAFVTWCDLFIMLKIFALSSQPSHLVTFMGKVFEGCSQCLTWSMAGQQ